MTEEQKTAIMKLRREGLGYVKISQKMGISENTVKSFCRRKKLTGEAILPINRTISEEEEHYCLSCGTVVEQIPGRKKKKFCSDKCRNKWWNSHLDQVERKANYDFICPHCKKSFTVYGNANRKYCSHECYIADRFGGGMDD